MIEDGMPEVVQARRLGHTLPDKIEDIYSHVAPTLETKLLGHLQDRWADATAHLTTGASARQPATTAGQAALFVPAPRAIGTQALLTAR